jgi:hypothetical protein
VDPGKLRPFRACERLWKSTSQGVALGCHVLPLRGVAAQDATMPEFNENWPQSPIISLTVRDKSLHKSSDRRHLPLQNNRNLSLERGKGFLFVANVDAF